jgi:hypothetical protein
MVTLKLEFCTGRKNFDLTESLVAVRVAPEKSNSFVDLNLASCRFCYAGFYDREG